MSGFKSGTDAPHIAASRDDSCGVESKLFNNRLVISSASDATNGARDEHLEERKTQYIQSIDSNKKIKRQLDMY